MVSAKNLVFVTDFTNVPVKGTIGGTSFIVSTLQKEEEEDAAADPSCSLFPPPRGGGGGAAADGV